MPTKRLLAASICVFLLGGCALGTQRFGRVIDTGRIGSLEVGVSTKADVLRLFGPPTSTSQLPSAVGDSAAGASDVPNDADSDAFVYEYREDRESFFTVLLFTRFRREVVSDRLVVFFDPQDVVRYVAFAQETGARDAE